MRYVRLIRIAVSCLLVVACGNKGPEKVELGQPVHPFGLVSDVWLGMTKDEVKQKVPSLKPNNGKPDDQPSGDGDWNAFPDGGT